MRAIKDNKLMMIIGIFGIVYSLISFVNHYTFRTYALDLGAYTNALFDYVHFQLNDSTVFKESEENLLADHFDLYLMLFSPLSLIFKTYTLLIVQVFFILIGGAGVHKYLSLSEKTREMAVFGALYFYVFFGVFSAVSFDYHSSVIAATLVPWFFCFVRKKQILLSSVFLFLQLISKENTSLWVTFICVGLAIEYRKDRRLRTFLLLSSVVCLSYFVLVTAVIMPALSNNNSYPHFQYSALGKNMAGALLHLFESPLQSIKILFTNHIGNSYGDFVKSELHILIILSGLPVLIYKPQYILMLIPVYFQKLFHDDYTKWGIGGQYCIEFAPVLAIGIFSAIGDFKNRSNRKTISTLVLVSTLGCTIRTMDHTALYTIKSRVRLYQANHYFRDYNIAEVNAQLNKIPGDAVVSVQSPFLPHLSFRDKVYQFPVVKDAEYVVYSSHEAPYPIEEDAFLSITMNLENSKEWVVLYKKEGFVVLKKKDS